MSKKIPWVAFFSQTGTEICDISKALGRAPDIVVTNAPEEKINEGIFDLGSLLYRVPDRPGSAQYFQAIPREMDTIITLHGWLRIIPQGVCEAYAGRIFNGHPGLISKYPELKGFNPQEKAFKLGLPFSGSVVHEVTAEVDAGTILAERQVDIKGKALDEVYTLLRAASLETWTDVLKEKLCLTAFCA